ncbi:3-oxoacyl-[acyl-carrier protein] reductase [Pseudarthrobacter defluvii]|uniref:3-oxoacyl-[acyl-carrier protein] reductase n=1 Tax=Pseudarthrobacter defluvii TaxID=410837 RepID=A0ABT9UMF4_9MICC|nr:SDR family NAD(P)-dependent oxidoreductase [Pseudarthrobacter defluvii]MDQ0120825.1 3-oxoacyl-[acyl-carrier protein] reductase [Pseudarthrobacter defluvii]
MSASDSGRVAVVTGGASGIGLATARRLNEDGHTVVIIDRSEQAHEVAAELSLTRPTKAFVGDLGSAADIERLTAEVSATFGGADILVNNAGIHPKRPDGSHYPIPEISLEQWNLVMAINVTAPFLLSQWAMEYMKERKWGRIVNLSSRAGRMYSDVSGAQYAASKAAIIGFTRNLAGECGPYNVTANTVAPGRIKTPLSDVSGLGSSQNLHEVFASKVPLRRVGNASELGSVISFLTSEDASFVTGAVIDVNGGIFG